MIKIKLKNGFGFSKKNLCRIIIFFSFVSLGYAQDTKVNKAVETQSSVAKASDKIETNLETDIVKAEQPLDKIKVEEKTKMPETLEEVSLVGLMTKSDFSSDTKFDSAKTNTVTDKKIRTKAPK